MMCPQSWMRLKIQTLCMVHWTSKEWVDCNPRLLVSKRGLSANCMAKHDWNSTHHKSDQDWLLCWLELRFVLLLLHHSFFCISRMIVLEWIISNFWFWKCVEFWHTFHGWTIKPLLSTWIHFSLGCWHWHRRSRQDGASAIFVTALFSQADLLCCSGSLLRLDKNVSFLRQRCQTVTSFFSKQAWQTGLPILSKWTAVQNAASAQFGKLFSNLACTSVQIHECAQCATSVQQWDCSVQQKFWFVMQQEINNLKWKNKCSLTSMIFWSIKRKMHFSLFCYETFFWSSLLIVKVSFSQMDHCPITIWQWCCSVQQRFSFKQQTIIQFLKWKEQMFIDLNDLLSRSI